MSTKFKLTSLLLSAALVCGAVPAFAAEKAAPKPLSQTFDKMVIIPYDYHGKAFINGEKTDLYGDYDIVQRSGRVLVPIRLMGTLASQFRSQGEWQTIWEAKNPDDVTFVNYGLKKTIKFKVNSTTMLVNNESKKMDVAPQKIGGRVVLPLRSAAEALGKNIQWLDGLIVMGDEVVDEKSAETLAVKNRILTQLKDTRKPVTDEKVLTPITKYGDALYYYKQIYQSSGTLERLYRKADGKKEVQVNIPGEPALHSAKVIGHDLYIVSTVSNQGVLYALDLTNNKVRKVSSLADWKPSDGWLQNVSMIDNELYVNLHSGDLTIGSETLYRVQNGSLKEVTGAKSIIGPVKSGDFLYHADFNIMGKTVDNLSRVNLKTGENKAIGQDDFVYAINRKQHDGGGTSYSVNDAIYVKGGFVYVLGYKDSDPKDEGSVYKVNPSDQTQVKLTPAAGPFWMVDNQIYYVDGATGYLAKTDVNGAEPKTVISRKVLNAQLLNGSLYYTSNDAGSSYDPGVLYQYDFATGKEIKRSDKPVSSYYIGKNAIYYLSEGYDPGIYKIDGKGNTRLVSDRIQTAKLTDEGLVYTLTYKEGVYSVK
ncbi:DUF5050 domain-containing protein [Paenibacillus cineris]|uniref:DUF5050 domain-containing protein n=1 Tax=Paenibacillus cineris TaxID=237530 RepID=UPI001B06A096|nr:DUF5050 domain-containing protein [Paenibacillus cineris]GIO63200.1 hypothetical protein J43TS9_47740 [Paenibacillus cineris]